MKVKKIGGVLTVLALSVSVSSADMLPLNTGWNLIGTDSNTSLSNIKMSLGVDNLLVIQGPSKTYQKAYVDAGTAFLNDFTHFEEGKGYWVKLQSAANLTYSKIPLSVTEKIALKSGWNLIAPLSDLNISTIKNQLGSINLLIIQGPSKTYQKSYVDAGTAFLNDFTHFEEGKGYWVKLQSDANLTFSINTSLTNYAVDNNDNNLSGINFIVGNSNYKLGVYTDKSGILTTSNSTIGIYGNINGKKTSSLLKINSNYINGDKFQVKVFDSNGIKLLGSSSIISFDGKNAINFGDINITQTSSSGVHTPPNIPTQIPPAVPVISGVSTTPQP